jgi:acetolactate synthase-1/3 small subunit
MDAVRHVAACLARRSHALLGLLCLPGAEGEGRLLVALPDDGRIPRLLVELGSLPGVREARRGERDCLGCFGIVAAELAA